ncbi:MAG: tetratricopeptide repeat protein [Eubacterium sp.]|nr:tetratricopeptide repeat protein [Eubacterium sp.]
MRCYKCHSLLTQSRFCPQCQAPVRLYRKIIASSNVLYNEALKACSERDLTGAVELLNRCLRLNKGHIDARNLLGLVYFELGEMTMAIEEWSISRALRIDGNEAEKYMDDLYEGAGRERIMQMTKKFNTALGYCRNGSYDLAMLQLKNVIGTNPNFVRARLVLALIYASQGDYDKARSECRSVLRIDVDNREAQAYIKEIEQRLEREEDVPRKRQKRESVSYTSGNETIIQPLGNYLSTPVSVMLNLVIGIVIGALVVYFLVVPGIRNSIMNEAEQTVTEANEQASAQQTSVSSLEEEIENLNDRIAAYESADAQDADTIESYQSMIKYLQAVIDEDDDAALEAFEAIDKSLLSGDAKTLYSTIAEEIEEQQLEDYYTDGSAALSSGDYEEAIELLKKAVKIDESYSSGKLLYNLAQAYRLNGDSEKAIKTYQKVIDLGESSSLSTYSQNYIDYLESTSDSEDDEDTEDSTDE